MADVLVVDDEASTREVICTALKRKGIAADTADDGRMAIKKLCAKTAAGGKYYAIILDIAMPVVNGWQVMQAIANNPLWRGTRVVALTAIANGTTDRARVSQYDGLFVEKDSRFPLVIGELVDRVLHNGG